jgi:hypothetical protein
VACDVALSSIDRADLMVQFILIRRAALLKELDGLERQLEELGQLPEPGRTAELRHRAKCGRIFDSEL